MASFAGAMECSCEHTNQILVILASPRDAHARTRRHLAVEGTLGRAWSRWGWCAGVAPVSMSASGTRPRRHSSSPRGDIGWDVPNSTRRSSSWSARSGWKAARCAAAPCQVLGKGRKKRATPLTSEVAALLRQWITERGGEPEEPLFPTRQGRALSRYTVGLLVAKHSETAAATCPSLKTKSVTPHVLRHTAAMLWRAKGVDIATIALLLGHESIQTTHIYEHADLALKEKAIGQTAPLGIKPGRYRASDMLLAYLEDL